MGRTLNSYRQMLEKERFEWERHFGTRLREPDRTSFKHLWEKSFHLADAASANLRPIIMDNILMSMLVAQQSDLEKMKKKLEKLEKLEANRDTSL